MISNAPPPLPVGRVPPVQWCGSSDDPDPITVRLLEFAREDWKCKAIYQLNFSSYCPPGAFCQQTPAELPPTTLDALGGWKSLEYAEVTRTEKLYRRRLQCIHSVVF